MDFLFYGNKMAWVTKQLSTKNGYPYYVTDFHPSVIVQVCFWKDEFCIQQKLNSKEDSERVASCQLLFYCAFCLKM